MNNKRNLINEHYAKFYIERKHIIRYIQLDLSDGTSGIKIDPFNNRNGYRLHGFSSEGQIENYFSKYYENFSLGHSNNNYYGIQE